MVNGEEERGQRGSGSGGKDRLAEALRPLIEEQKALGDRVGKLNHSIEVGDFQER